jgi:hypothetical protein
MTLFFEIQIPGYPEAYHKADHSKNYRYEVRPLTEHFFLLDIDEAGPCLRFFMITKKNGRHGEQLPPHCRPQLVAGIRLKRL